MSDEHKQGYPDYFQRSQFPDNGYKIVKINSYSPDETTYIITLDTFVNNTILEGLEIGFKPSETYAEIIVQFVKYDGSNNLTITRHLTYYRTLFQSNELARIMKLIHVGYDKSYFIFGLEEPLYMLPGSYIKITLKYALSGLATVKQVYREIEL